MEAHSILSPKAVFSYHPMQIKETVFNIMDKAGMLEQTYIQSDAH